MKHKSEDYKISAVKYYLKNKLSMEEVCNIFECKKQSLSRWIERYSEDNNIVRHNKKLLSYKITKTHVYVQQNIIYFVGLIYFMSKKQLKY